MRHYCSLADSKYLPQLLALYESLKRHSSEPFVLHVLPLDDATEKTLRDWNLDCLDTIKFLDFFFAVRWTVELSRIKDSRTHQEWCWTLASQFSEWLLVECETMGITYLDADMMFFSDPKVIHDEIGDRSIAVIPHRFIPSKQYLEVNGKFNVSWVTFKNNPIGRECLSTWAAQCREKCSLKDGCGDQKYLDAWPQKYGHELCVIENIGAGLAPWNLANYEVKPKSRWKRTPLLYHQNTFTPVVFFHYHEFRDNGNGTYRLTNYDLRDDDKQLIYEPYLRAVSEAKDRIETISV